MAQAAEASVPRLASGLTFSGKNFAAAFVIHDKRIQRILFHRLGSHLLAPWQPMAWRMLMIKIGAGQISGRAGAVRSRRGAADQGKL